MPSKFKRTKFNPQSKRNKINQDRRDKYIPHKESKDNVHNYPVEVTTQGDIDYVMKKVEKITRPKSKNNVKEEKT